MANTDAPSGLKPVRHYFGGLVRANEYRIASALGANIFTGDPVKSTGTTKQITVATAGDTMLGVFAGVQYTDSQGNVVFARYWPTGTAIKTGTEAVAYVYDDPFIVYEVQASGSVAAADIGNMADLTFATAGSTVTGTSGVELDSDTIGDTGDIGVKIIDYVRGDPSNALGTNAKVLVLINQHEHNSASLVAV